MEFSLRRDICLVNPTCHPALIDEGYSWQTDSCGLVCMTVSDPAFSFLGPEKRQGDCRSTLLQPVPADNTKIPSD